MLKTINVSQLQPGMMVSEVTQQNGPVKIRKVGMIRSPEMIKGLTEMGVQTLVIDLAQSIGVEMEDEPLTTSASLQTAASKPTHSSTLTPTQQLMQNDRLNANVDRNLSQQFHRSMFMPSADNMPTQWDLYGKNAAIMLLLVVGGICFGWNLAKIPTWFALLTDEPTRIEQLASNNYPLTGAITGNKAATAPADNNSIDTDKTNTIAEANSGELKGEGVAAKNVSDVEKLEAAVTKVNDPMVNAPKVNENEVESSVGLAEQGQQAAPLVLGYQPETAIDQAILERSAGIEAPVTSQQSNEQPAPAISPELMAKFNAAIAELDANPASVSQPVTREQQLDYDNLPRVDQLSNALLSELPSLSFSAHMYASDRDNRWVRVNGLRLVEGDFIANNLQIVNIEPQRIVLSFKEELFVMNALSDW